MSSTVTTPGGTPVIPIATEPVTANKGVFWTLEVLGIVLLFGLLCLSLFTWNTSYLNTGGLSFTTGQTAALVLGVLTYWSIREGVVPENRNAGVYFLGLALAKFKSGPHLLFPFLLMRQTQVTTEVLELDAPGQPEEVFHGSDDNELPPAKVRPIRVTTRGPKEGENDILDARLTLEIMISVRFVITDVLSFVRYLDGSIENAKRQMDDICRSILAEQIARLTTRELLEQLGEVNRVLVEYLEARFGGAGIEINAFFLKSPDLSHTVSKALGQIAEKLAQLKQAEAEAEAKKILLTGEGEGKANAEYAMLEKLAEGIRRIADTLQMPGNEAFAIEVGRQLAQNPASKFIMGSGGAIASPAGLVAAAKALVDTFGNTAK